MRLLYVTEDPPNRDPERGDGSSLISFHLLLTLPADVEVTLLTWEGAVDLPVQVRARCREVVVLPRRPPRVAHARAVLSPWHVGAQERATPAAVGAVRRLSAQSDVTLLHGPHVAVLARAVRGPLVLQVVDPWSFRRDMEAELASGVLALYRRLKAAQSRQAERGLALRARILTVSSTDAARWSRQLGRPVRGVPNGVAVDVPPPEQPGGPATICFVGSLDYEPNVESAEVLVREVAPVVWRQRPDVRVVLAGRRPVDRVLGLVGERVRVLANVPSVGEVFAASRVAVFPDRRGLGVRNSVLEALAAGTPVVASPVAARGIDPHPRLAVGETADDLAHLVVAALAEDDARTVAGRPAVRTWPDAAREYVDELTAAVGG